MQLFLNLQVINSNSQVHFAAKRFVHELIHFIVFSYSGVQVETVNCDGTTT